MFEFAEIDLGVNAKYLIQVLPPAIPFAEFRRISLPSLEPRQLEKWPWGKLREMKVVDSVTVYYEDQEDGRSANHFFLNLRPILEGR